MLLLSSYIFIDLKKKKHNPPQLSIMFHQAEMKPVMKVQPYLQIAFTVLQPSDSGWLTKLSNSTIVWLWIHLLL